MTGIDLHVHSKYSPDGDLTIEELFRLAVHSGVKYISVTDHNSVISINEGIALAGKFKLEFIPGVEFNSNLNGRDIHILGYFIDPVNRHLTDLAEDIKFKKALQARARIEKLKKLGFNIAYEDAVRCARGDVPNGSIFFDALIENSDNRKNSILREYIDGKRSDSPHFNFYRDFFRYGKPAYAPLDNIETRRVIETINESGGVAVFAHPFDTPDEETMLIIGYGIKGIEVYSSYHSMDNVKHFNSIAKKYGLIPTAGSDFHGSHKPRVTMGIFKRVTGKIIRLLYKQAGQRIPINL